MKQVTNREYSSSPTHWSLLRSGPILSLETPGVVPPPLAKVAKRVTQARVKRPAVAKNRLITVIFEILPIVLLGFHKDTEYFSSMDDSMLALTLCHTFF